MHSARRKSFLFLFWWLLAGCGPSAGAVQTAIAQTQAVMAPTLHTVTNGDGDTYTGEWVNGTANGQGTMNYGDGDIYTGEWKDNQRNGKGTIIFANGD